MTNDNRVRFSFRLPAYLYAQLKSLSQFEGVSTNAIILKILWKHFELAEKPSE